MAHTHDNTKKRTFSHLTAYDRGRIGALRDEGKTFGLPMPFAVTRRSIISLRV